MHLSARQLAALNGAVLEESLIEQVARLEAHVKAIPHPPAPTDLAPVLARLDTIQERVRALPDAVKDNADVLAMLMDMRKDLAAMPAPAPADLKPVSKEIAQLKAAIARQAAKSYTFDIVRDDKEKIVKVTATPARQTML